MMNINDRVDQIVKEYPAITSDELADQLRKEGYAEFIPECLFSWILL